MSGVDIPTRTQFAKFLAVPLLVEFAACAGLRAFALHCQAARTPFLEELLGPIATVALISAVAVNLSALVTTVLHRREVVIAPFVELSIVGTASQSVLLVAVTLSRGAAGNAVAAAVSAAGLVGAIVFIPGRTFPPGLGR